MMFRQLDDVGAALKQKIHDPSAFSFVNTRLVLRTGINLNAIRDNENTHVPTIERVLHVLDEMGFSLL